MPNNKPISKPNSEQDVFNVMKAYCKKKGYSFTDDELEFIAEICYLHYESKAWGGTKYWPPLAKRWILVEAHKRGKTSRPKGKSIKKVILDNEEIDI